MADAAGGTEDSSDREGADRPAQMAEAAGGAGSSVEEDADRRVADRPAQMAEAAGGAGSGSDREVADRPAQRAEPISRVSRCWAPAVGPAPKKAPDQ